MNRTAPAFLSVCLLAAACSDGSAQADAAAIPAMMACEVINAGSVLPDQVRETSGLGRSARDPALFWTHNDAGNEPVLFAIGLDGAIAQTVRVTGATLNDWEDLAVAPCDDGACLFVGDIGDNDGEREWITVYRIPEPAAGATESAPAAALHARYPDGPRDAEALFTDASGRLHIVTKGRNTGIALYRFPAQQNAGETATLERVRELFPQPDDAGDRVTAAAATPDRRWVGIRTSRKLYMYAMDSLIAAAHVTPAAYDLSPLREAQGESLVIGDDGTVWTSSEAENNGARPRWWQIRCQLPEPAGIR